MGCEAGEVIMPKGGWGDAAALIESFLAKYRRMQSCGDKLTRFTFSVALGKLARFNTCSVALIELLTNRKSKSNSFIGQFYS